MHRLYVMTCAAVLALLTFAGTAALAGDAETVAACLQSERDAHGCIGRVSGPCMGKPEGQSTVGMVECISTETQAWDDILNKEYPPAPAAQERSR